MGGKVFGGYPAVPESRNHNRLFRFGTFEFDAGTGELRKDGRVRQRLLGQPLEVLLQLLDDPGQVVTREELRNRLWPADTFVDYDHSLNAAVSKLRDALNDAAENARFIQTIPRRGYRFIAPVEIVNGAPNGNARLAPAALDPDLHSGSAAGSEPGRTTLFSDPRELPVVPRTTSRLLFSLIQVLYLVFYVLALFDLHRMDALLAQAMRHFVWLFVLLVVTAAVGIPVRLYLLSSALFGYRGLTRRFLTLFPLLFPLDELWALAPFLIVDQIGAGLALAATAAFLYLPFSQRSLLLMGDRPSNKAGNT
jgi:cholera toxin transcriptional activator